MKPIVKRANTKKPECVYGYLTLDEAFNKVHSLIYKRMPDYLLELRQQAIWDEQRTSNE
jgi:hypothetical protein